MKQQILYGLSGSVYTRIARTTLEEKAVDYVLEEVDIFDENGMPEDYLKLHPFGRIPAFVHGEFKLYETGAITRYIDEAFPGISLQPNDPQTRARMNQVISLLDSYAYQPMIWAVFVQRISIPIEGGMANEAEILSALPLIEKCLQALEALCCDSAYFAGSQLTLADLHALPILLYFNQTAEGEKMISNQHNLSRWLEMMKLRNSVESTKSIYGC